MNSRTIQTLYTRWVQALYGSMVMPVQAMKGLWAIANCSKQCIAAAMMFSSYVKWTAFLSMVSSCYLPAPQGATKMLKHFHFLQGSLVGHSFQNYDTVYVRFLPTYICIFPVVWVFIPRKWKYSPHAFCQRKSTFPKHAYDHIHAPSKCAYTAQLKTLGSSTYNLLESGDRQFWRNFRGSLLLTFIFYCMIFLCR